MVSHTWLNTFLWVSKPLLYLWFPNSVETSKLCLICYVRQLFHTNLNKQVMFLIVTLVGFFCTLYLPQVDIKFLERSLHSVLAEEPHKWVGQIQS